MKNTDKEYRSIVLDNICPNAYSVSEYGDVYSHKRDIFLKQHFDSDGYKKLSLQTITGKRFPIAIHRIVAFTFLGKPSADIKHPTVDHIDGNKLNNHYSNLRWCEREVNSSDRLNTAFGEHNGSAILKEGEVSMICVLLQYSGMTLSEIASCFGVEKSTISNIRRRKHWSYISKDYDWTVLKIKNKKESLKQREEIVQLFNDGYQRSQIVRMGYPSSVVSRVKFKLLESKSI